MCGTLTADATPVKVVKEGWLKKKGHHVGVWKDRYFRFDGLTLFYWKSKEHAEAHQPPRGELMLTGCSVVAYSECRLMVQALQCSFDEELKAKSDDERDAWVRCFNDSAIQHRLDVASGQVDAEGFLGAKGLWGVLAGAAQSATPQVGAAAAQGATGDVAVTETVLAHTMLGSVVLRLSEEPSCSPRQGRLVVAGRRFRRWMQHQRKDSDPQAEPQVAETQRECWALLVSARSLREGALWVQGRASPGFTEPGDSPVAFEALHAYADSSDGSAPFMSLPLLRCKVGAVRQCADRGGWAVQVEDEVELSTPCVWTLIVETRGECEKWRRALDMARRAAHARHVGRRHTNEEIVASFDEDRAAWHRGVEQRLADARMDTPGCPPRTDHELGRAAAAPAFQRVLGICEDVCCEAEDMLEAALQHQPVRRDICEAAVEAALDPALARVEGFWARWGAVLSQGDGGMLLRWLQARQRAMHQLGAVCASLDTAISKLAVDLGLRMGEHLRRILMELLVLELGRYSRSSTQCVAPPPTAQCKAVVSTLPVDLFTMVFSCMPFDQDHDVLEYRLSSQRVAKFMVCEVQEVLGGWLFATQREALRDIKSRLASAAGAEQALLPDLQQWLLCVVGILNSIPNFVAQCHDFNRVSFDRSDVSGHAHRFHECLRELSALNDAELGPEVLPREWSLGTEVSRFDTLSEAFLWAACDAVSAAWRHRALGAASRAGVNLGFGELLNLHLDGPLHVVHGWLEPSMFERLLPKLFHVCLGVYVKRLSRGQWFQEPPAGSQRNDMCLFQLSEDTKCLCGYFQDLAGAAADGPSAVAWPWEPREVFNLLHGVLSSTQGGQRRKPSSPSCSPQAAQQEGRRGLQWHGLSQLQQVLSEGPLPLRDVVGWFGADLGREPFDDLPPMVPPDEVLRPGGEEGGGRCSPDTGPWADFLAIVSYPSARAAGRPAPPPAPASRCSPRDGQAVQLLGHGAASDAVRSEVRCRSVHTLRVSVDGKSCELSARHAGTYGVFCDVCKLQSLSEASSSFASSEGFDAPAVPPQWRRRWAQLARHSPHASPCFQVLDTSPQGPQAANVAVLRSMPLALLQCASTSGTTELDLIFEIPAGERRRGGSDGAQDSGASVQYSLRFDCPSHLFRWQLVLQAWWDSPPAEALRPLVAFNKTAPSSSLFEPLTRQVLRQRFGSLWCDVQSRLEISGNSRPNSPAYAASKLATNPPHAMDWRSCKSYVDHGW